MDSKNKTEMKYVSLARLALDSGLSNLQITSLNALGEQISLGNDDYMSYYGLLTDAEDVYLRTWLRKLAGKEVGGNGYTRVIMEASEVATMDELARGLSEGLGWKKHEVRDGVIYYTNRKGKECRVDQSGFGEMLDGGKWVSDEEENVDWDQEFAAWSDHVWGKDEAGNVVMVHN